MTMPHGYTLPWRAVLLALACLPSLASATPPAPPSSGWTGLVSSPSRPATTVEAAFGTKDVSLHFGEPANCRIVAAFLYREDEQTFYRFHPSTNGGSFCAGMYPGELTITQAAAAALTLVFRRADASWSGTLAPAAGP